MKNVKLFFLCGTIAFVLLGTLSFLGKWGEGNRNEKANGRGEAAREVVETLDDNAVRDGLSRWLRD